MRILVIIQILCGLAVLLGSLWHLPIGQFAAGIGGIVLIGVGYAILLSESP